MRKFNLWISVLLAAILPSGVALPQGAASSGMAFLKMAVGARAVGLGEAYVAVADDISAAYWNPAGLAAVETPHLLFAHTEWLQDITHDYVGFASRGLGGAWGVNLISAGVGEIESRTQPSAQPLGTFGAHNLALGFSYGSSLGGNLSLGFTAKWLYEKIFTYEATGAAVDFGTQMRVDALGLRIGAAVQNLGSMGRLREESTKLPLTLRAGIALPVRMGDNRLLLATDLVKIADAESHANLGAEWRFADRYSLRLGYQTGFDARGVQGGAGWRVGRFQLDYGFVPFSEDLGTGHRFSMLIRM